MDEAKIRLSQSELELMCNAEMILTKNIVLQKIKLLLEAIQKEQVKYVKQND
ncbi:MAG: hypothetical protein ICV66_05165, partial [Chitinophagaceae bacterium]|nr:hypothetical protein [Chitinophagaceae bacterium]